MWETEPKERKYCHSLASSELGDDHRLEVKLEVLGSQWWEQRALGAGHQVFARHSLHLGLQNVPEQVLELGLEAEQAVRWSLELGVGRQGFGGQEEEQLGPAEELGRKEVPGLGVVLDQEGEHRLEAVIALEVVSWVLEAGHLGSG